MAITAATAALIGAGISAAGAMTGSAINAGAALRNTAMRNEAQKRESELAYLRQRQAIREQNAYNSASAQMARLQSAGLNPNLMYENGQQAAAGTQDDIAKYEPADIQNASSPMGALGTDMINSIVGLKDMQNKTRLAESQLLVDQSTIGVNVNKVKVGDAQAKEILDLLGWKIEKYEADIKNVEQQTKESENRAKDLLYSVQQRIVSMYKSFAEIKSMSVENQVKLALLPDQKAFLAASAEERQEMATKAATEYILLRKYYNLDVAKFDWTQESFYENLNFTGEQNKLNRRLGYWNLGARSVEIGVLGATTLGRGMSLGQAYGTNPWNVMSGSQGGFVTSPTFVH